MKKLQDKMFFENINEFLSNYLPKIQAKSSLTVLSYKTTLNLFLSYLCVAHTTDIFAINTSMLTNGNIVGFLEWLEKVRGNSLATVNIRLSCIRTFVRYLVEYHEHNDLVPTLQKVADIQKRPVPTNKPHEFLTKKQVQIVLASPETSTKKGLRDQTILILLYDTGCRAEELLSMRLGDFTDLHNTSYVTITGKKKKMRSTPISEKAKKALNLYKREFHAEGVPNSYLFYTVHAGRKHKMSSDNLARIMLKYEKQVRAEYSDLPHLHPHLWRHTRAQILYDAGMPLEMVTQNYAQRLALRSSARRDVNIEYLKYQACPLCWS